MNEKTKKTVLTAAKILISLVLLGFLVFSADLEQVHLAFQDFAWPWALLALVFVGLAPLAIIMVAVTAARLWAVRSRPVAQTVMVYLFFAAGLLGSNLLELVTASDRWTLRFAQINYIFLFGVAVSWFAFAVVYSGREEWARSGTTIPLAGLFVIALGVVFTAESHGLFWSEIAFIRQGPFRTLHATYGPLFWVVGTTLYAVLLFGTGTLIRTAIGLPLWYRRQARILVAAAVVPLGFNLMYVLRVVPWLDKDFTPLMYALSGIGFYLSMERRGLVRQRLDQRSQSRGAADPLGGDR